MKTENEKTVESYRDWIEPIDVSPERDEIEQAWVALLDARDALTPDSTEEEGQAQMDAEDAAKAHLVRVVRESETVWPGIQDFIRQLINVSQKVTPSRDPEFNKFTKRQVSLTGLLLFDLLAGDSPERRALSEAMSHTYQQVTE